MATVEALKEMIIDLRIDLVRANIPYGNCPYAYYSTSKQKDRENCNDISCDDCTIKFLRDIKDDIRKEIEEL